MEDTKTTAMKLNILILTILLSPIFINAQNAPACDSVFIDCCTFDSPEENTIGILVSNYSSDIFSYPGFILFTENMDTMAIETVNYYGIGWSQTHILNIIHPIALPFEGVLELHTGFYDTQVCSFPILIPDSTLTQINDTKLDGISIYPNPAHNSLNLQYENPLDIMNIHICDLSGKIIRKTDNGVSPIDISDLRPGIYFIKIKENNGNVTRTKFIKK